MNVKGKEKFPILVAIIVLLFLIWLPTGYEDALIYKGTQRCQAIVTSVNNSKIVTSGLIQSGEQSCELQIVTGKFKGQEVKGTNLLSGSLDSDKIYEVGDKAYVVVSHQEDKILSVTMIDHYRINKELILAGIFALLLVGFAGKKGLHALLSFAVTVLAIWKILIPSCLKGVNPILIGLGVIVVLTAIILSLVYGFDRRWCSSLGGAVLGILTTCILGIIFTKAFQIHGVVMSNSQSLLYSGYENLDLTRLFMSSIFIGASGAVMDLAVDITSAIDEVVKKKPEIGWKEATISGFMVGRAAMGTMTTTLLLAYSGGYLALLMVFMAQGTPILNILNYNYVSSEILETVIGSIGLVTVAPFTAIVGGYLLTKRKESVEKKS